MGCKWEKGEGEKERRERGGDGMGDGIMVCFHNFVSLNHIKLKISLYMCE